MTGIKQITPGEYGKFNTYNCRIEKATNVSNCLKIRIEGKTTMVDRNGLESMHSRSQLFVVSLHSPNAEIREMREWLQSETTDYYVDQLMKFISESITKNQINENIYY